MLYFIFVISHTVYKCSRATIYTKNLHTKNAFSSYINYHNERLKIGPPSPLDLHYRKISIIIIYHGIFAYIQLEATQYFHLYISSADKQANHRNKYSTLTRSTPASAINHREIIQSSLPITRSESVSSND